MFIDVTASNERTFMHLTTLVYSLKVTDIHVCYSSRPQRIKYFVDIVRAADTFHHITTELLVLRLLYLHVIILAAATLKYKQARN
jgi:uncharacterized membrane protein YidH (DUF202 family)